ncbi:maleylpyruvate isomerase N-terminal domain-containing protein [Herbidospora mongoliensis]|uniref:maleylpyruvate isomerase N-terminal domain-containing protein n=1 Tax=Herbidospora mongoliensis TaxID=688067 RepID=UPI00082E0246|nr:maleylpyruvate isomerase N-terminal domain-containing protein [Herbidospora mongoliensis]
MSLDRLYLDLLDEAPIAPPSGGRAHLLTTAAGRRRPAASCVSWARPYAGRIAALDAVFASATAWDVPIVEGWNLQELLTHLMAKDGLLAAAVGAPVHGPPIAEDEAMARTRDLQHHERSRSLLETRQSWRDQADTLCHALSTADPTRMISPGGLPLPIGDQILGRALETWIHTHDTAVSEGLTLPHPVPDELHAMADLCARLLPLTAMLSGLHLGDRAIRLTLTGDGGGDWHIPLTLGHPGSVYEGQEVALSIRADAVEFCFVLGGRGADRTWEAEGDLALAADLRAAAPALSGP